MREACGALAALALPHGTVARGWREPKITKIAHTAGTAAVGSDLAGTFEAAARAEANPMLTTCECGTLTRFT